MDLFYRKHRRMFIVLGVDISNEFGRVGSLLLRGQFFMVMVFLCFHFFCFLLGVLWRRQYYTLIPTLIMSCGVVTGCTTLLKHQMLARKKEELNLLMQHVDGYVVNTSLGKYTKWLMFIYEGMGLLFITTSVAKNLVESPELEVAFPVWEPYEVNSPLRRLAHFFCFYYSISLAWLCIVSIDTAVLHFANQLCHRFHILDNTLGMIGVPRGAEREEMLKEREVLALEDYDEEYLIKSCIQEHVLLLRLTDVLAKLLNETFVYQSTNSMSVLLVCLYVFANSKDWIFDTLSFSGALVAVFVQVLTSCWAGELIKTRYEGIHFGLYANQWVESAPRIKSSLLVMATFTSRSIVLKGAYVFNLSLQTYETFIRQAFSFFTVMYQFLN